MTCVCNDPGCPAAPPAEALNPVYLPADQVDDDHEEAER